MTNNNKAKQLKYKSKGNITILRNSKSVSYENAIKDYVEKLEKNRGAVFSSNYEYPGRYTRWDTAIVNPPLAIEAIDRILSIKCFNKRGEQLLAMLAARLQKHEYVESAKITKSHASFKITEFSKSKNNFFTEELRSRKPNIFSLLREIVDMFYSGADENLALYGAFGYDLAFQFENQQKQLSRNKRQRDLVLYLPDEILVVDHHAAQAWHLQYEFSKGEFSTIGLSRRTNEDSRFKFASKKAKQEYIARDLQRGEYARLVKKAKAKFKKGDLFEVVLTQIFREVCRLTPSQISKNLRAINPSPYSFFINLGEQEFLIGASPEMFVRVEGRRVETCPISGTIKRGNDPIEDSQQILKLLNSKKDESELTMCSDVDRNDKSRVCEPGSVKVIGRRQIEIYSKLIHTVDHIEGRLRNDMDAFDAFLSHAWAVTVTGAPKLWAMRFIEANEKQPRNWYGGAVGMVGFNGNMNTGLTLRTIRIKDGIAEVRAGATLLYDSNPKEEEAETELKASAMLAAIRGESAKGGVVASKAKKIGQGINIVLVDHEDSFVHTLANYFRQTGASVNTIRTPVDEKVLLSFKPNLIVLSPGPGCPADFSCEATIDMVLKNNIGLVGVCLGHQAIGQKFGAKLGELSQPFHGKPSRLKVAKKSNIFSGLGGVITVGRYHSLYIEPASLSAEFAITAKSEQGTIMAIEHKSRKIAGIQFHPESIMSVGGNVGFKIVENIVEKYS